MTALEELVELAEATYNGAVIVEADLCDGRVFSSDGTRAQLSDFFNTILV